MREREIRHNDCRVTPAKARYAGVGAYTPPSNATRDDRVPGGSSWRINNRGREVSMGVNNTTNKQKACPNVHGPTPLDVILGHAKTKPAPNLYHMPPRPNTAEVAQRKIEGVNRQLIAHLLEAELEVGEQRFEVGVLASLEAVLFQGRLHRASSAWGTKTPFVHRSSISASIHTSINPAAHDTAQTHKHMIRRLHHGERKKEKNKIKAKRVYEYIRVKTHTPLIS